MKHCEICQKEFSPEKKNQKFCPSCVLEIQRNKQESQWWTEHDVSPDYLPENQHHSGKVRAVIPD